MSSINSSLRVKYTMTYVLNHFALDMCKSLIYLKSNGEKLNCDNYVNQAKNNRKDDIPIKDTTKRTIHPTAPVSATQPL